MALFDAGSSDDDAISGISMMANGALAVGGNYNGTMDFGTSSAQSQSTSVLPKNQPPTIGLLFESVVIEVPYTTSRVVTVTPS